MMLVGRMLPYDMMFFFMSVASNNLITIDLVYLDWSIVILNPLS
jgi:hypothetical protein